MPSSLFMAQLETFPMTFPDYSISLNRVSTNIAGGTLPQKMEKHILNFAVGARDSHESWIMQSLA
jgi:hypothetical protein